MKTYSLSRRLVGTVLLVQLLLTGAITASAIYYEKQQEFQNFDVMLRGRADSLLGAVRDAEDEADNVVLDAGALDLPTSDMYAVRQEPGRLLGQSRNWTETLSAALGAAKNAQTFRAHSAWYRGLTIHGVRTVDEEDGKPGVKRPVRVMYAAPLEPVWTALRKAVQFLILANGAVLALTAGVLLLLLRRGLLPLHALAQGAQGLSGADMRFTAPPQAMAVRELAPLAGALELSLQRLARSFDQQRTFLHDAAHEMKTAVTVVKSSLQQLSYRTRSVEGYQKGLEVCLTDCERMEDLVAKMLTLARLEQAAAASGSPRPSTSAAEAVEQALAFVEPLAAQRNITVRRSLQEGAAVNVPAEELGTMLNNLLVNAAQHSSEGGLIEASVTETGGMVEISIRDKGAGIDAKDLPHVFDRFYRGDRSRSRVTGGTGLGLAICRVIAEGHGGRISIASELGRGTQVLVQLPGAEAGPTLPHVQAVFTHTR